MKYKKSIVSHGILAIITYIGAIFTPGLQSYTKKTLFNSQESKSAGVEVCTKNSALDFAYKHGIVNKHYLNIIKNNPDNYYSFYQAFVKNTGKDDLKNFKVSFVAINKIKNEPLSLMVSINDQLDLNNLKIDSKKNIYYISLKTFRPNEVISISGLTDNRIDPLINFVAYKLSVKNSKTINCSPVSYISYFTTNDYWFRSGNFYFKESPISWAFNNNRKSTIDVPIKK